MSPRDCEGGAASKSDFHAALGSCHLKQSPESHEREPACPSQQLHMAVKNCRYALLLRGV